MAKNKKQIEKLKALIQHTSLLDETQKQMWLNQVLPKASSQQLEQMEAIFQEEQEAYRARAEEIEKKRELILRATKKVKSHQRKNKEKQSQASESADLENLENQLATF